MYDYRKEARAILEVFKNKRIKARVMTPVRAPAFVMYRLDIADDENLNRVESALHQISLRVSQLRGEPVQCRLNWNPLYIELPAVEVRVVEWDSDRKIVPHTMLFGRSYGFKGGQDEVIDFRKTYHVLVAGTTGSGKSVLMRNLIMSLTRGTSPRDCQLFLVDLKLDDLLPFRGLPHVAAFAGDEDQAQSAVDVVFSEMIRRRNSLTAKRPFRLVLVVDELSLLPKDALEKLIKITALGRSMWINVIAAIQTPSAEFLGGIAGRNNYTTRLGGLVADSTAANLVTGRAKSGAQFLPGNGSFLRVEGANIVRTQTFFAESEVVEEYIEETAAIWADSTPATVKGVDAVEAKTKKTEPAGVEEVFLQFFDGGDLRDGWIAAAIRARFGNAAATGGRNYRAQREEVSRLAEEWLDGLAEEDGVLEGVF